MHGGFLLRKAPAGDGKGALGLALACGGGWTYIRRVRFPRLLRSTAPNSAVSVAAFTLIEVLVATDVAARGIHVDKVGSVIHFDPPEDHKTYVHRSGRTARAGASGTVVTVVTPDQKRDVDDLTLVSYGGPDVGLLVKAGKVKALAVLDGKRYARLPNVPSISETLPGFRSAPLWFASFGPAGLPRPITLRLQEAFSRTAMQADVRATLEERGAMEYTVVVNAPAGDEAVFKYLAPYAGCAIGQHWMYQGQHVLIIFDDLSPPTAIGTIWSSSPCITRTGTVIFLRSSVKSVSENALMPS